MGKYRGTGTKEIRAGQELAKLVLERAEEKVV